MEKKKGGIGKKIGLGIAGFLVIAGIAGSHKQATPPAQLNVAPASSNTAPAESQTTAPIQQTAPEPASPNTGATDTNLSNSSTYVNVDGNTVHSPADSTDGSIPAGATAQCVDGTYSFSQNHSGTCSHHGGVAGWL